MYQMLTRDMARDHPRHNGDICHCAAHSILVYRADRETLGVTSLMRVAAGILVSLWPLSTHAQDSEALAKAAQNPIARMISLPIQSNTNLNVGPSKGEQEVVNIQPVYPISLNRDWNLITRTVLPLISQPELFTGQGRTNGIGDMQFSAFFSPVAATAGGWIWRSSMQ